MKAEAEKAAAQEHMNKELRLKKNLDHIESVKH